MDLGLIFAIVVGGAVGLAGPVCTQYLRYLSRRCPENALRMEQEGDPGRAIRHLEWALSRLSSRPDAGRTYIHQTLGEIYLRARRFSDAEAQLHAALNCWRERKVKLEDGSVEAQLRLDIAQALEARGDTDGAQTERDLAVKSLFKQQNRDWSWHILWATELNRRADDAKAVTEYKISLHDMPVHVPSAQRTGTTLGLATCLINLERPTEALSYLRQSLNGAIDPHVLPAVHYLAGLQCFKLGHLDDAERYYQAAIQANVDAEIQDLDRQIEIIRMQIGQVQLMRGDLNAARQTADSLSDLPTRTGSANAELLACDLEMIEGNFSLSLDHIQHLRDLRRNDSSVFHSQFVLSELDTALSQMAADLYQTLNEPQKALSELQSAQPVGQGVSRWSWDLLHIRVLAQLESDDDPDQKTELRERTRKLHRLLESDLARRLSEGAQPSDAATVLRQPTSGLSFTAYSLGMYPLALQLCQHYLEMNPYPVNLPRIYCLIGDCHAALGRKEDACAAWRTAVSFGIETHRARIAAEHLAAVENAG